MKPRVKALSVHLLTATGAVLSMLALLAAANAEWSSMFLWLVIALIVDGVDGPLARRYQVKKNWPTYDGVLMDLIIDYLTYVFIPAYALFMSGLLPGWTGWIAIIAITYGSVIYFADTRMKTRDYSFAGFPACWNMVVLVLFATDPPYLVDYDGSNHPTRNKDWSQSYGVTWDDSSQGAELYDGFIAAAVAEAITDDAAWYCWHASRRQAMLEACWEKAGAFVHQQIIWVKDRGVLTRSHYLWKHEPCFMGWVRPHRPPKVADEMLASTWVIPSLNGEERPDHPTPKPLDCFAIPMRQHVARGGLCYEPFSGSGSQIMAGEATGRRVFAMEISPAYVDVAVERWQAETGVDGFNVSAAVRPADLERFAALVSPELRRRGLLREPEAGRTLRENVAGGGPLLPEDHRGARFR